MLEVKGSNLGWYTFSKRKTGNRNILVETLFGIENVRDIGGKKLKCFGKFPLGTGSQRHMAEMF